MKKSSIIAILTAIILTGACVCDIWYTHALEVQAMQDSKTAELQAAVDPADYREAEKAQIEETMKASEAKIRATGDEAEMDSVIESASAEFAKLKTDEQYTKEEEEEARRQAELERQRQEEEARKAAEAAAAAANKKSKKKSSGSKGCVGGSSDNFY